MSYQTRECSIGDLEPELQKTVKQFLDRDEHVLLCFQTFYSAGSWLLGKETYRYAFEAANTCSTSSECGGTTSLTDQTS